MPRTSTRSPWPDGWPRNGPPVASAELLAILDAAKASPKRFKGLDGPARYYLYLAACGTGYRAQELASLMPEAFALDARPPTATVSARRSKNRRVSTQPLPDGVVAELRAYLAGKPHGERLWPGSWWGKAAEMLQIDLAAAGVPYTVRGLDGVDRYADFHALRHTYITYLAVAGVSPKNAQELARHSDIRLTMERYTHARQDELAESVNRLALPSAGGESAADPLSTMPRAELERTARDLAELVGCFVCTMFALENGSAETPERFRSGTGTDNPAGAESP
jgi:integrase